MIIKGKSRTGPEVLGPYLQSAEKNERVSTLEIKGTVSQDLVGALVEMDAYAEGTRCVKPLYHAQISPEPPHRLTRDQCMEAVDALEEKLGLTGHSRVVVMHEKLGREHFHVVWSRIDLDNSRSVGLSHNYRKHEEVARDLERRFGHDRVQGAHAERDGVPRPDRTPSRAEQRQEERTGIKGKDVKAEVSGLLRASDDAKAFHTVLGDAGYILCPGDRRDFVIVDRAGGIHSLARRIDGMRAAELREFMAPIDRDSLPNIEQAKEIQIARTHGETPAPDIEKCEDALAAAAIKKEKELEAERKLHAQEKRESHAEGMIENAYTRGEDYVSQTQAALKDDKRHQEALNNDEPRPQLPGEPAADSERVAEIVESSDRSRRDTDEASSARDSAKKQSDEERVTSKFDNVEMTEAQRQRMQRMLDNPSSERDYDEHYERDPDRQQEAPGGGRTRSR